MLTTATGHPRSHTGVPVAVLDGASRLRVLTVLAVIIVYTDVVPLQYSMVAIALQPIAASFPDAGVVTSAVIVVGLVGVCATPLLGPAGQRWGAKRTFLACGGLYFTGCVVCALTHTWAVFLFGRGLAAFAVATQFLAYGLIRELLPPSHVRLGIGMAGAGLGFSGSLAPLLGGVLADAFSWRAVFWFLAAAALVATVSLLIVVPSTTSRPPARIDTTGAILLSGAATLTLLYLDNGRDWGWTRPGALTALTTGLALFALFLGTRTRCGAQVTRTLPRSDVLALTFAAGVAAILPMALGYLVQAPRSADLAATVARDVAAHNGIPESTVHVTVDPGYSYGAGFSVLGYALHLGVWAGAASMAAGPVAIVLAGRHGPRLPAAFAFTLLTAAATGFAVAGHDWRIWLPLSLLAGAAFGLLNATLPLLLAEAALTGPQLDTGAGVLAAVSNLSTGVAVSVMTALLDSHPVHARVLVGGSESVRALAQVCADTGAAQTFWAVAATAGIAVLVAILPRGRKPQPPPRDRSSAVGAQ